MTEQPWSMSTEAAYRMWARRSMSESHVTWRDWDAACIYACFADDALRADRSLARGEKPDSGRSWLLLIRNLRDAAILRSADDYDHECFAALAVDSDALQASGDVRGEWLARWLLPEGEARDRALAEVNKAITAEVWRRALTWPERSILNHTIDFGKSRGLFARMVAANLGVDQAGVEWEQRRASSGKTYAMMVVADAVVHKPSVEAAVEEAQAPVGVRARLSAETLRMLGGAR